MCLLNHILPRHILIGIASTPIVQMGKLRDTPSPGPNNSLGQLITKIFIVLKSLLKIILNISHKKYLQPD